MSNNRWPTISELKNSAAGRKNPHLFEKPKSSKVHKEYIEATSDQKEWLILNIQRWCNVRTIELVPEYRFARPRRWRFDFALPLLKVAVEYEGITAQFKGHTNKKEYTKDAEKYNAAARDGWQVLRYTSYNFKQVIDDLNDIIETRKNKIV